MKKIITLLSVCMCMLGNQAEAMPSTLRAEFEGKVEFQQSATVTCLAIGCPPSLSYFYVKVLNAESSDQLIKIENLHLNDVASALNIAVKPESIEYNGIIFRENDTVRVDVSLLRVLNGIHSYAFDIYNIEVIQ